MEALSQKAINRVNEATLGVLPFTPVALLSPEGLPKRGKTIGKDVSQPVSTRHRTDTNKSYSRKHRPYLGSGGGGADEGQTRKSRNYLAIPRHSHPPSGRGG